MGLNDEIKKAVDWDTEHVDVEDSLRTVIQKMAGSKSSSLVVKNGDTVVGVITDVDLMKCLVDGDDLDTVKAKKFMTACELITSGDEDASPCAQLDESESVLNALKVMEAAGVHNLLVSGDKDKVGTVSARKLLECVV